MKFEWDPTKAATNIVRHGVTFEQAKDVFIDARALEALDEPSSDEERWRLLGRSDAGILMVTPSEEAEFASFRRAWLIGGNGKHILSKSKSIKRNAGARTSRSHERDDRENPPLGADVLGAMKRVAPIKRIRWQLGLSQEEFARRFEIPIGTLRDWEQGRSRPDRPARAYLKVIGSDPAFVGRALQADRSTSTRVSRLAAKSLSNPKPLGQPAKGLAASALAQSADRPKNRTKKSS